MVRNASLRGVRRPRFVRSSRVMRNRNGALAHQRQRRSRMALHSSGRSVGLRVVRPTIRGSVRRSRGITSTGPSSLLATQICSEIHRSGLLSSLITKTMKEQELSKQISSPLQRPLMPTGECLGIETKSESVPIPMESDITSSMTNTLL